MYFVTIAGFVAILCYHLWPYLVGILTLIGLFYLINTFWKDR
jgi:hypothetical protein